MKIQTTVYWKMTVIHADPSPSGSRMSESSVSSRPERKCCCRKGTESSNIVATPWSCTMLENAELCGHKTKRREDENREHK